MVVAGCLDRVPVGGNAGKPKHHLAGRVLNDDGLARVFGCDFEDVASDRRCPHFLELVVAHDDERPPAGGVGMNLTGGVVVSEEGIPGVRASPSPKPDPSTEGGGHRCWVAAAIVRELNASRIRRPHDDAGGRLGSGGMPAATSTAVAMATAPIHHHGRRPAETLPANADITPLPSGRRPPPQVPRPPGQPRGTRRLSGAAGLVRTSAAPSGRSLLGIHSQSS
jgi:hypothetical protein